MSYENQQINDTIVAGMDLSAYQYKFVTVAGSLGTSNANAYGVLKNKPLANEHATVTINGLTKIKAGGAIAAGGKFKVSSGFAIAVASGDGVPIGTAKTAAASGDTFVGNINTANCHTST